MVICSVGTDDGSTRRLINRRPLRYLGNERPTFRNGLRNVSTFSATCPKPGGGIIEAICTAGRLAPGVSRLSTRPAGRFGNDRRARSAEINGFRPYAATPSSIVGRAESLRFDGCRDDYRSIGSNGDRFFFAAQQRSFDACVAQRVRRTRPISTFGYVPYHRRIANKRSIRIEESFNNRIREIFPRH